MKSKKITPILFILFITLIISTACIDREAERQRIYLELTITAQAQSIQQTAAAQNAVQPQTIVIVVTATPDPLQAPAAPAVAAAATNTAEPAKPEIINSTLCWLGPGDKYVVSSSVSKGQFVELLGRGDTSGWIIVLNPIYKEPCWVQAFDIKLDPSIDVNSLKVYYAPLPSTKTPKPPTVVPTNTP